MAGGHVSYTALAWMGSLLSVQFNSRAFGSSPSCFAFDSAAAVCLASFISQCAHCVRAGCRSILSTTFCFTSHLPQGPDRPFHQFHPSINTTVVLGLGPPSPQPFHLNPPKRGTHRTPPTYPTLSQPPTPPKKPNHKNPSIQARKPNHGPSSIGTTPSVAGCIVAGWASAALASKRAQSMCPCTRATSRGVLPPRSGCAGCLWLFWSVCGW